MWRRSSSLEEIEAVSPEDSTLARLLPQFTYTVPIRTDPAGASVYIQSMEGPEDEWDYLGVTPLQGVRFAGFAFETEVLGATYGEDHPYRLSFELDGHRRRELLLTAVLGVGFSDIPAMDPVALRAVDADLDGMVRISGFTRDGIEYDDYYLDRYEVTNEAFKEFVDAGGYSEVEHWVHSFVRGGVELSFEEAMAFFKDQTGRPGPSTWRLGTFAEGQGGTTRLAASAGTRRPRTLTGPGRRFRPPRSGPVADATTGRTATSSFPVATSGPTAPGRWVGTGR